MLPAARLSAAIEVFCDIEMRRRPASDALKDWGLAHRFAGSKDRAAIASLVYDALRRKASAAWIMGEATPRAVLLGMLRLMRGLEAQDIAGLCSGERFAPSPLSSLEHERLSTISLAQAPLHIQADAPEWAWPMLEKTFGDAAASEVQALATRAPLDIRVNALKITRKDVQQALAHWQAQETPLSPLGLRFPLFDDGRGPSLQSEPEFLQGFYEVQDEGSQLAALLCGARPNETIIDLCAGGGGKTLALAAQMQDSGRLVATDNDPRRLAPLHARLERAGVSCVEVRTPRGSVDPLSDLAGQADCVVIDAPCTGSGTWRRNPDAKWRLRPGSLNARLKDQEQVIDRAIGLLKPGGRIVYITCSILTAENDEAIQSALQRHPHLSSRSLDGAILQDRFHRTAFGLQLTPYRTGTDGFYVAGLVAG